MFTAGAGAMYAACSPGIHDHFPALLRTGPFHSRHVWTESFSSSERLFNDRSGNRVATVKVLLCFSHSHLHSFFSFFRRLRIVELFFSTLLGTVLSPGPSLDGLWLF